MFTQTCDAKARPGPISTSKYGTPSSSHGPYSSNHLALATSIPSHR
jgi:hypothetical protein